MAGLLQIADPDQVSPELFQCPLQPGRLRLSRHACTLRYLLSQNEKISFPNDEFGMALRAGFAICRNCSEGRYFAEIEKPHNLERATA